MSGLEDFLSQFGGIVISMGCSDPDCDNPNCSSKQSENIVVRELTAEEQVQADEIDKLTERLDELNSEMKDLIEIGKAKNTIFWKGIRKSVGKEYKDIPLKREGKFLYSKHKKEDL